MGKFTNPLDDVPEEDDPPKKVDNSAQAKSEAKGKKKPFTNPLGSLSKEERLKAIGSTVLVGRYAQRTMRLPPLFLEKIRELAKRERLDIAEAERWIVGRGLAAYFNDNEKLEFTEEAKRDLIIPAPGGND
jgi:hypothetical protein